MWKIGPYELSWKNPLHYLILWVFTTLILLVIAGVFPQIAMLFAFAIVLGTIFGIGSLKKG